MTVAVQSMTDSLTSRLSKLDSIVGKAMDRFNSVTDRIEGRVDQVNKVSDNLESLDSKLANVLGDTKPGNGGPLLSASGNSSKSPSGQQPTSETTAIGPVIRDPVVR